MYKIFHGFHLVEAYQDLKKAKRLAKKSDSGQMYKANRSYYPFPYFMAPPY